MTWKELQLYCKGLGANVSKTWINWRCVDVTKNGQIKVSLGRYHTAVVSSKVSYEDMHKVVEILCKYRSE